MATTKRQNPTAKSDRVSVLTLIETPIRFFALVVLVVELLLGGLVAITTGTVQLLFVGAMLFLLVFLVTTVAYFAFYRPEALSGKRPPSTRVQLSTGLLDLLQYIAHSPDKPAEYAAFLEGESLGDESGWRKAAVYGCLLLVHLGLVEVVDGVLRITERGRVVVRPYFSSRPMGEPVPDALPDDDELFSDQ